MADIIGNNGLAVFAMAAEDDTRLKALRDEVADLVEKRDGIVAAADEADTDLSDDQLAEVEELTEKIEAMQKQIAARERVVASRTSAGRRSTPEPTKDRGAVQAVQPRISGGKGGFKSFGEFAIAVRHGSLPGAQLDQRLQAAATTWGGESTGADGGFAVPPDFRNMIWQKVLNEDNLLMRCDQLVTSSNSITVPADETTPWQSSGGIQAFWEGEAAQIPQSRPLLEMKNIRLNKLTALVPVSEELLEDAPGIESYLRSKAPAKMISKINTAVVRGTGVGQPLGILNAPSLITVSKEGTQAADTVLAANVVKMWARMYAPSRRNSIWLINQDIEPSLDLMVLDPAATNPSPVYLPVGGLSSSGFATLKGRPVVPVEACSTLGDLGDIILVDLTQYMGVTKGQDIRTDVSMHLFFDQALLAFRFILRVNGMPWWGSSITPQFGTATRSWAVALENRA